MFKFWAGPTAKVFSDVEILDFKLEKRVVEKISSALLSSSGSSSDYAPRNPEFINQKSDEDDAFKQAVDVIDVDSLSKRSKVKKVDRMDMILVIPSINVAKKSCAATQEERNR